MKGANPVKPLLITLGAVLAFVICAFFITADGMSEALSVAVLIAAAWGIVRWGVAALRAFWRGAKSVEQQGVIGIVLLLVSIIAQRVYAFWYITLGRPDEWNALHISPFITFTTLIALILFITATKYPGERPTPLGGIAAASIAFFAVMVSSLGPWIAKMAFATFQALLRAF